jgi:hypothetical protein
MDRLLPVIAVFFAICAVLGTDRLGRPLTDHEKKKLGRLLREHDYPGARLIALRFAYKLTRGRGSARDLMGRVDLRLVRLGWDPSEVSLVKRLCRLVWSEWTNTKTESDAARRAEENFLVEMKVTEGRSVPSVEQQVTQHETREELAARAQAQLDRLRAAFKAAGDEVNLLWLDWTMAGETDDPKTMAERSGRNVEDFYAAAKRRKRAVQRLLAEDHGAPYDE